MNWGGYGRFGRKTMGCMIVTSHDSARTGSDDPGTWFGPKISSRFLVRIAWLLGLFYCNLPLDLHSLSWTVFNQPSTATRLGSSNSLEASIGSLWGPVHRFSGHRSTCKSYSLITGLFPEGRDKDSVPVKSALSEVDSDSKARSESIWVLKWYENDATPSKIALDRT